MVIVECFIENITTYQKQQLPSDVEYYIGVYGKTPKMKTLQSLANQVCPKLGWWATVEVQVLPKLCFWQHVRGPRMKFSYHVVRKLEHGWPIRDGLMNMDYCQVKSQTLCQYLVQVGFRALLCQWSLVLISGFCLLAHQPGGNSFSKKNLVCSGGTSEVSRVANCQLLIWEKYSFSKKNLVHF